MENEVLGNNRKLRDNDELKNTVKLFGEISKILAPPPKINVSEWAERYRVMSTEDSAFGGAWSNDFAPYQREMMDAVNDPRVEEIVLMTAAQVGKTSVMLSQIGYFIDCDPCPMIIYQPTGELAEAFTKSKLNPMIRNAPRLNAKIPDNKGNTPGNTVRQKDFPGGYLTVVGASSPNQMRMRSIRVLWFDELDAILTEGGSKEGDLLELAKNRTSNFPNRKLIYASTPTVDGIGGIDYHYDRSSREEWTHRCPACGEFSPFDWQRLHFDTMTMECPHCHELNERRDWTRTEGKWVAQNPERTSIRGFRLTALDAPTLTWRELVSKFIEAKNAAKGGNTAKLQSFINTVLAETWNRPAELVESHDLEKRREVYNAELPDGVCVLTAGVDTQDNRLEYEVVGWGEGLESWGIEYGALFGDTAQGEVWNLLDQVLTRKFSYANGKQLPVFAVGIDMGGHRTHVVKGYCAARHGRGVYTVFGDKDGIAEIVKKARRADDPHRVGVSAAKSELMGLLKISEQGAGYCHFPKSAETNAMTGQAVDARGYDSEFFKMLTAEKRVLVKDKRGNPKYVWEKTRDRNEALDTRVYARAALKIRMPSNELKMLKALSDKIPWRGAAEQTAAAKPKNGQLARTSEPAESAESTQAAQTAKPTPTQPPERVRTNKRKGARR